MLKILGVCGSPRKKSTYTALEAALGAAEAEGGIETEFVSLRGKKIAPCVHCNKCLRDNSTTCTVYHDDMDELYQKVYDCDGLLLASPVYEMGMTAQMAAFLQRFRSAWLFVQKEPYYFAKKVGACLTVGGTRNGGQESTINNMAGFFHTHGFTWCTGGSGLYSGASLWNPGDGSGTMDDPDGMNNAVTLGKKLAWTVKRMNGQDV